MIDHPFLANNFNTIDETFYSTTPTYINGQNVFLSQEKQRKLYDGLQTSIVGLSPNVNVAPTLNSPAHGNFVQAEKCLSPYGVIFTFPAQVVHPPIGPTEQPQSNYTWMSTPCPSPMPPAAGYPPSNVSPVQMDYMPTFHQPVPQMNHEHLFQNPYTFQQQPLTFHHDKATSSFDLLPGNTQVPGSRGMPDLSNISGVCYQKAQYRCCDSGNLDYMNGPTGRLQKTSFGLFANPIPKDIPCRHSPRKLVIKTRATHPQQHVAVLDKPPDCSDKNTNKKNVSFANKAETMKAEKSQQVLFPCYCSKDKPANNSVEASSNTEEKSGSKMKQFFKKTQNKMKRSNKKQSKQEAESGSCTSDSEDTRDTRSF